VTTRSLTAAERETIVLGNDADDTITVWSAQRPVITRLRKLVCAELVDEGQYGTTAWAKFTLPAEALSFRNPTSAAQRERQRQAMLASGRSPRDYRRPAARNQDAAANPDESTAGRDQDDNAAPAQRSTSAEAGSDG
jgi:hypothetical protein